MPESVALQLIRPDDRPLLERLWQLYQHDLSEFRSMVPDEEGRFTIGHLPTYFNDPDRCGYLFHQGKTPAGFAFVSGLMGRPLQMSEFFVVRAVRRQGVGRYAARQVFMRHPGFWEVSFQEENGGAAGFWRRVVAEVSTVQYQEERPPGRI